MESSLVLQNLLSAPVLFFFLGILAVLVGSDLEIPSPLPKLFSLYLLLAIGFKGGMELARSGLEPLVLLTIGAAVMMSLLVPLSSFAAAAHPARQLQRRRRGRLLRLDQRRHLHHRRKFPQRAGGELRWLHGGGPGPDGVAGDRGGGAAGPARPLPERG